MSLFGNATGGVWKDVLEGLKQSMDADTRNQETMQLSKSLLEMRDMNNENISKVIAGGGAEYQDVASSGSYLRKPQQGRLTLSNVLGINV